MYFPRSGPAQAQDADEEVAGCRPGEEAVGAVVAVSGRAVGSKRAA